MSSLWLCQRVKPRQLIHESCLSVEISWIAFGKGPIKTNDFLTDENATHGFPERCRSRRRCLLDWCTLRLGMCSGRSDAWRDGRNQLCSSRYWFGPFIHPLYGHQFCWSSPSRGWDRMLQRPKPRQGLPIIAKSLENYCRESPFAIPKKRQKLLY